MVLCEGGCMVVILEFVVGIKFIEKVIIDWGFEEGWIKLVFFKKCIGKWIVVIGLGLVGFVCVD